MFISEAHTQSGPDRGAVTISVLRKPHIIYYVTYICMISLGL